MSEPTIGGHKYRIGRLNAFAQLHIMRKLLPLVTGSVGDGEILAELRRMAESRQGAQEAAAAPKIDVGVLMKALGPGLEAFARLPAEDVELIVNTCLGVVKRDLGGDRGFADISAGAGVLMYADIDLVVMLQIVWRVLEDHLDGFFHTLQQQFPAAKKAADAS